LCSIIKALILAFNILLNEGPFGAQFLIAFVYDLELALGYLALVDIGGQIVDKSEFHIGVPLSAF
jgi:hypothetical protein